MSMFNFFSKDLPKNTKKRIHSVKNCSRLDSSANNKKHKICGKSSTMKDKTQSYLDFGQKSFGISATCPKCSMVYVVGVDEDEKNHINYCRSHQKLNINSLSIWSLRRAWMGDRVPSTFSALTVQWEDIQKGFCILKLSMDADVFRSKKLSSAQRWRAVVEVILTDMGAHDNTLDERGCSLYLYVNTIVGEVMGMIITEQVHKDDLYFFCPKEMCLLTTDPGAVDENWAEGTSNCRLSPHVAADDPQPKKQQIDRKSHSSISNKYHENSMRDVLTLFSHEYTLVSPADCPSLLQHHSLAAMSSPTHPFTIGIKQMWVSAHHRRQGVARQLLDCARLAATSDPRCPLFIDRYKVAFSQPTSDGLQCALRYVAPMKAAWLYSQSSVNRDDVTSP